MRDPNARTRSLRWLRAGLAVIILTATAAWAHDSDDDAAPVFHLSGVVTDSTGAAVAKARIVISAGEWSNEAVTGPDGKFSAAAPAAGGSLVVRAPGFAELRREWTARDAGSLTLVLSPAPAQQQVTVTATRTALALTDTPASVQVVSSDVLRSTAAVTLDDALRQVAGFSVFRRAGSRTANPTTQGVSLRGTGASGASRALVLADGVPLNDPFGGWVYWDRVPRESIDHVEVLRGGASDLYGSDALGGVVSLSRRPMAANALSLAVDYGSEQTPNVSMNASGRAGDWAGNIAGEFFRTGGYVLVDKADRGAADVPADSDHRVLSLGVERLLHNSGSLFARGSLFRESRHNGTPLQVNSTSLGDAVGGGNYDAHALGSFSLRLFGSGQQFQQTFSAVAADRNSEKLSRAQQAPAQQAGLSGQWWRALGPRSVLVVGLEARDVRGHSDELIYTTGASPSSRNDAGGRQRSFGLFAGDVLHLSSRLAINLSGRFDRWSNFDAARLSLPLLTLQPATLTRFPDRDQSAFSPRAGALYRVNNFLSLTAAGYRAFRAPTLNELYRSFRVGDVLTTANENLRAERLAGGETGVITALGRAATVRATFFWAGISQPVANVTLTATPALITRQRQNLGSTRSRGLDVDFATSVFRNWQLSAGYEFADATVTRFPANRLLEGLAIPQVPQHQFTVQARYANPRLLTFAFQGRAAGTQFDDDRNLFPLDPFFVADVYLSRAMGRDVELFAAAENLFDQRYAIGRTPVRTLGPPILARVGLRVQIPSR